MGKYEVLDYMQKLRQCGDDSYYKYCEVHRMMRRDGLKFHYSGVWRSMLSLYKDDQLEAEWEGKHIKRNPKFRAKN